MSNSAYLFLTSTIDLVGRDSRHISYEYGYFYPESSINEGRTASDDSGPASGVATAERFLFAFSTSYTATSTQIFSSTVTTTITCSFPTKVSKC